MHLGIKAVTPQPMHHAPCTSCINDSTACLNHPVSALYPAFSTAHGGRLVSALDLKRLHVPAILFRQHLFRHMHACMRHLDACGIEKPSPFTLHQKSVCLCARVVCVHAVCVHKARENRESGWGGRERYRGSWARSLRYCSASRSTASTTVFFLLF